MKMLVLVSLVLCSTFPLITSQECFNVNTNTQRIVDTLGRERLFHGMNVVVKGPPWIPQTEGFDPRWSFSEKDLQTFDSLGWNAIRLGMMWPGAEPQRDQFNETYFSISKWIVNKAASYNISVLFDMHQDCLSPKFCGEGAPDWAIFTGGAAAFPEPVAKAYEIDPETGYPKKEDCAKMDWALYYFARTTSAAFQYIYNNSNGLLDEMAEFWGKVASEFKDFSNILGYEIINEPWAGDFYHDPLLIVSKIPDRKNLQHMYDVIGSAIWKNDPCHNVFFESITWDETTIGFKRVPVDQSNNYRSVVSYHIYVPPQFNPKRSFKYRMEDVHRLSCGGFLSEFGVGDGQVDDILNLADTHFQSWTGWDYKAYYGITGDVGSIWYDNGTMNTAMVTKLSRTFPSAVAGNTISFSFDPNTKDFYLIYRVTENCKSQLTEIYLNEDLHYFNGYKVTVSPSDGSVTWSSPKRNRILISHSSTLAESTMISVYIERK